MLKRATLLFAVAVAVCACQTSTEAAFAARPTIRLVRDATISDLLAQEYAARLPNLTIEMVDAVGSVETVDAIQHDRGDIGFSLADVAYFAYLKQAEHPDRRVAQLRGLAALQSAPIHLLVRSGLNVHDIVQLRGHRVGVGTALSGQRLLASLVFKAYQLGPEIVQPGPRTDLLAGVDATFATQFYPAPTVTRAMSQGAQLIPIEGDASNRLRQAYPFIRSVVVPAGTYPGQAQAVRTIAVDRLFICRADLDEGLIHDLTQAFLEALPGLATRSNTSLRLTSLDETSATSIPLHAGAALYYRERELAR